MAISTRFRAILKHEISAVDVEALLRGSGQLEDLRQRIEQTREAGEVAHPGKPWETHAEMGYALVFFWVAQGFATIARALKEADDDADSGTQGYMPEVSHDQSMALLRQVADYLGLANAALADPSYDGGRSLPIPLQPRIEAEGRCPVVHLRGMLRGSQRLNNCVHVEVETYCRFASQSGAPADVQSAAKRLQAELARAESNLKTAEQAVYPIFNGQPVDDETHEEVENYLWSSLEIYLWLGQAVAMPSLLNDQRRKGHRPPPPGKLSRTVSRSDEWCLTSDRARQELESTGRASWARDELDELWTNKRWKISAQERQYLDEVAELERQGAVRGDSYLAECPFNPIWTTLRPVTVVGQRIPKGQQFAYNHHHGKGQVLTGFHAVDDFEECEDDD